MPGLDLKRAGLASRDQKVIAESWSRCRDDYGLDQWTRRHETVVRRERVRDSIQNLGPLFSACRSQVQHIFENIVGSGHAVILTDKSGTIVEFAVQSALEDLFRQNGLRRGADWSESVEGTNGIGTAIREKKSLTVYRDQHFHSDHASLTCTGAPVFDVEGNVLALFDVSSIGRTDDREIVAHTRALLEMSARLITRRNFQDHFSDQWILRFHRDAERVGLLEEGLIALDQSGRVVGADEQAVAHLDVQDRADIIGADVSHLFEMDSDRFEAHLVEEGHGPARLSIHHEFAQGEPVLHARMIEPKGKGSPARRAPIPSKRQVSGHAGKKKSNPLADLVGRDAYLADLADKALRLFEHDIPLLISGETGVGKDSFAKALHQSSLRADKPFIAVNCGALPENLLESELFGYKAGAFTGAQANGFKGQILAANGGTLLLDEIGDMPLSAQTRLLQVLERRQVTPLGSSDGIDLDIRLLAATHQPLERLVAEGRFREDLYYRISGFTLALSALRDRNDLSYLVARLLPERRWELACDFTGEAKALLMHYHWPGNIRQLKHVLKTAHILADGCAIDVVHLNLPEMPLSGAIAISGTSVGYRPADSVLPPERGLDFSDQEKQRIEMMLAKCKWNVSHCASALGISRNTLYRKMRAFGIRRSDA